MRTIAASYQCRQAIPLVPPLLAIAFCGKANAYAQHHKFRMAGFSTCPIGQATRWRPLSVNRLVLCSRDKNGGLLVCYRPLRSNSFAKSGLAAPLTLIATF